MEKYEAGDFDEDAQAAQSIFLIALRTWLIDGPGQLWVAGITYVAIRDGFAYFAVILDAWS